MIMMTFIFIHIIAIAPPSNIMQRHYLSILSSVVLAFCRHHTANSFNPTATTMVVSTRSSSSKASTTAPAVISTLSSSSAASAATDDVPGSHSLDADDSNNPKKKNVVDSPSSPSTKTPEWVGQPEEPFLAGIKGWTKRTFRRQNNSASAGRTRLDSYWYSPGGHKFRSTTEVKKFLKALEEHNDDEEAAYENLKSVPSPIQTTPKKTPAVDFTAFAAATAASTNNSNDDPGQKSKKRSPSRWNIVTPSKKARSPSSSSSTKKKKKSPSKKSVGPATQSFGALTGANFTNLNDTEIEVHTLILGTHPSIKSLSEDQYFGHAMNAFWWIAGDCLGFRRNEGVSPATGKPYALANDLRYDNTHILPYEKQIELFCSKGFALWDIVASCHRPGSLDSDITKDKPNDIPAFCQQHPRIRRIVLANGVSGCKFFKKHFKEWLDSGRVVPDPNDDVALTQFKKWGVPKEETHSKIQLVSALAVSPAAAKHSYVAKRNFWEQFVYKPGLADFETSSKQ